MGLRDRFNQMTGRTRYVVSRIFIHLYGEEIAPLIGILNRNARTAIDSADDCILELTDYCYRKLLALLSGEKKKAAAPSAKELMDLSPLQDLNRQINDTEFNI